MRKLQSLIYAGCRMSIAKGGPSGFVGAVRSSIGWPKAMRRPMLQSFIMADRRRSIRSPKLKRRCCSTMPTPSSIQGLGRFCPITKRLCRQRMSNMPCMSIKGPITPSTTIRHRRAMIRKRRNLPGRGRWPFSNNILNKDARAGLSDRLNFFGPYLEACQRIRPERIADRDVGGVAAAGNQHAADPRLIVPGVERMPLAIEVGLEPSGEIHRLRIGRHADIAEIAGAVTGWNVHAAAQSDRQVGKVAADTGAFLIGF